MSIINIAGRRTNSSASFENHRFSDSSQILLDTDTIAEAFSVEFTIGSNWSRRYGPNSNQMETIPDPGILLKAGQSVVVEVNESLRVPHNMYGLVIPTGRLFLDNGIILAAAKIEPSFHDRLKLRLVNVSGERRILQKGQKVASAIFFSTERTIHHDDKRKSVVSVTRLPGHTRQIATWVSTNRITVIGWIVVVLASAVSSNIINRVFPLSADPTATDQQSKTEKH